MAHWLVTRPSCGWRSTLSTGRARATQPLLAIERLWTMEEVAEYLAMSVQTLYGWRCRRYGPPSYRIGNKVRYRPDEVRAWVDQNEAAS